MKIIYIFLKITVTKFVQTCIYLKHAHKNMQTCKVCTNAHIYMYKQYFISPLKQY